MLSSSATGVQVELLIPPEEMLRGGGHQSLHLGKESDRGNSLCMLRTFWLSATYLLSIVTGCPVQYIDGSQGAHSDIPGAAITSI